MSKSGVTGADLLVTNNGTGLVLNFSNGTDSITINNWYSSWQYRIEELVFDDGTIWDQNTLHMKGLSIYGTDQADTLEGTGEFNTIYGFAGDDTLGGAEGSTDYYGYTIIDGIRRGNDYYGSTGNDTLRGTYYSDHYYFNSGDGHDIITDRYGSTTHYTERNSDKIILGAGITGADLLVTNNGTGLVLNFSNGTDSITINNWYNSWQYRIEELVFDDGTIWDQNTLHMKGLSIYGTDQADTLEGTGEFNTIYGFAGDDTLGGAEGSTDYYGYTVIDGIRRGNDYYGSTGNDTLRGTYYSDHYYFNSGDGHDVITDRYGSTTHYTERNSDKIILGAGITGADLLVTNNGTGLVLNFSNGTDSITINNWYSSWQYRVEELVFDDGTIWDQNTLHMKGLSIYGTDQADTLEGTGEFNTIYGFAGDDTLGGNSASPDYSGYTIINGEYRGNDYYGGTGNDTLRGTKYADT